MEDKKTAALFVQAIEKVFDPFLANHGFLKTSGIVRESGHIGFNVTYRNNKRYIRFDGSLHFYDGYHCYLIFGDARGDRHGKLEVPLWRILEYKSPEIYEMHKDLYNISAVTTLVEIEEKIRINQKLCEGYAADFLNNDLTVFRLLDEMRKKERLDQDRLWELKTQKIDDINKFLFIPKMTSNQFEILLPENNKSATPTDLLYLKIFLGILNITLKKLNTFVNVSHGKVISDNQILGDFLTNLIRGKKFESFLLQLDHGLFPAESPGGIGILIYLKEGVETKLEITGVIKSTEELTWEIRRPHFEKPNYPEKIGVKADVGQHAIGIDKIFAEFGSDVIYFTPDKQHTVQLHESHEFEHRDGGYYNISIDGVSFGRRLFWDQTLWSADSRYFLISEILSEDDRGEALMLFDLAEKSSCVVETTARGHLKALNLDGSMLDYIAYSNYYKKETWKRSRIDISTIPRERWIRFN